MHYKRYFKNSDLVLLRKVTNIEAGPRGVYHCTYIHTIY